MLLSIISPIYKGEKMLDKLIFRIEVSVETFTKEYEIFGPMHFSFKPQENIPKSHQYYIR